MVITEKDIVGKKLAIANHENKICHLAKYRCDFLLVGDLEEMLRQLEALCLGCQYVDVSILYSITYSAEINNVAKSGRTFDNVQRVV